MLTVGCVVTSWNYGMFLPEALASLAAQTRAPDQVVIADDASTDDSVAIASAYAEQHGWEVSARPERRGFVGNANAAIIEDLNTDLAFILSADDWLESQFVELHAAAFDAADINTVLAYCGARYQMTEPGAPVAHLHGTVFGAMPWRAGAIQRANFVQGSAMFRRSAFESLGGFEEKAIHEDWALWKKIDRIGYVGVYVPHVLLNYRHHARGHRNFGTDSLRESRT